MQLCNLGQGNIVNDVLFGYNNYGQLTTDYQSHEDAVNLASTPRVQYTYADGSENTVRPTALVYPNGRELHYDYGSTGEMNAAASRVASLIDDDGTTHLVDYSYLGRGSVVEQESPQPDLLYALVSLTSSNDPDTGDIYAGLDRFGRVKDLRWRNTNSNTDLSRVEYGYDRASNRIWRKNPTDPNAHYDWLYTYDAIQRLKSGERGTLNSNGTEIADPQFAQCWSLDATGNWRKFLEDDNGDLTWNLIQTRTSSTVNEITNISETAGPSWVTPAYSKAGNMITMPQPADPTASFTVTYDAWNRLTKLTDGTDTVQENVYDGRNFRVIQKTYIEGDLDETRQYYFTNNWQIIEERLDANSTPDRHFVWGIRYIDDLICRDRSESGTLDERLYPLPDANWNVTALVNTSGAVVERIEYDPYGNTTWLSSTFVGEPRSQYYWETTYCSYRFDAEPGLFKVRHRVYHPALGTWITKDPVGYFDGLNSYEYVSASPLNKTDPPGLLGIDVGGTRVKGRLGCLPVYAGISACLTYEVTVSFLWCECEKICASVQATVSLGFYVTGTVLPHYPSWPPRVKMLPIGPGGLPWPVPTFPFVHGIILGCPPEGCHGTMCITGSVGLGAATAGCRFCYYPSTGTSDFRCGTNIGAGTGIGGGGGVTCTWCK